MDLPFLLLIAVIAVVLATAFIASWIHRDRPRRAASGGDWFVSDGAWSDGGNGGSSDCGGSDGGGCGGGD